MARTKRSDNEREYAERLFGAATVKQLPHLEAAETDDERDAIVEHLTDLARMLGLRGTLGTKASPDNT